MDLNLLSLFVVVAECESFSTAADQAQPATFRRLAAASQR